MMESRIAVALVNATLQSGLVLLATLALVSVARRLSASARCALWMISFGLCSILPAANYWTTPVVVAPAADVASQSPVAPDAQTYKIEAAPQGRAESTPLRQLTLRQSPTRVTPETAPFYVSVSDEPARPTVDSTRLALAQYLRRASTALFWIWMLGAAVLATRFLLQLNALLRLKRTVDPLPFGSLPQVVMGARAFQVGVSDVAPMPCVLGLHDPMIAIPRALLASLSRNDLRRIVMHESAHVRRYDDWFNAIEQLVVSLFFINPVMHYIARQTTLQREIACDDVVTASGDRLPYAECLSTLARQVTFDRASITPGFAASGRQLLMRIKQVLDRTHNGSPSVGRLPFVAAALLVALVALCTRFSIPVLAASQQEPTNSATIAAVGHRVSLQASNIRTAKASVVSHAQSYKLHKGVYKATGYRFVIVRAASPTSSSQPREVRLLRARPHVFTAVNIKFQQTNATWLLSPPAAPLAPVSVALTPMHLRDVSTALDHTRHAVDYVIAATNMGQMAVNASVVSTSTTAEAVAAEAEARAAGAGSEHTTSNDAGPGFYVIETTNHQLSSEDLAAYAKALQAAGYKSLTPEQLRVLRDHDVNAQYARAMSALAHAQASVSTLIELRDHDVSQTYAEAMKTLVHNEIQLRELSRLRDHDVSAALAQAAASLNNHVLIEGLPKLSDHGVSAEYLKAMAPLVQRLNAASAVDHIARLCDHGVTPEYVRALDAAGYGRLTDEEVTHLYDHGVTVGYLQALTRLGYGRLSVEDITRLYDEGVTPSEIEHAKRTHPNQQLSVEDLIRIANDGS